jgi:hypothetical protein
VIIRMQKGDMGIPLCAHVDTETERMILWKTEIIRVSFIYKGERAGRGGVPGIHRKHVESGSQLRLEVVFRFEFAPRQVHGAHHTPSHPRTDKID